ncbi:universal stress protein [Glaciimonas soli]|nr:universal stress protein [Glaciimonas soli]
MQTCLVGYTPDAAGEEALSLARIWARAHGWTLVVCVVAPEAWGHPSLAKLDVEYANFLSQHTQESIDKAQAFLVNTSNVRYIRFASTSVSAGLLAAAKQENADLIVLGSSRSGPVGGISTGGMISEIMHSSEFPIAIAPRGYSAGENAVIERFTCAYSGLEAASGTVHKAHEIATAMAVPLRLVSFAVRDGHMYPPLVGYQAEESLADAWREQAQVSLTRVKKQLASQQTPVEIAVAVKETWEEALNSFDWLPGEMLILGSSRMGVLKRVFLGSNANKIIQASPVSVMVLPRAS